MTFVAFVSVKGSPGVTTTACLVGATWPADRRVVVVESDPAGGDLAARFSLSSHRGWPTFLTAARRSAAGSGADTPVRVDPHLQRLPGGLEVLSGTRALSSAGGSASAEQAGCVEAGADRRDVLVDLGRLDRLAWAQGGWLDRADLIVLMVRADAASVLRVQEARHQLVSRCGERLVLTVVRNGRYTGEQIEEFLGIPVVAQLPYDPGAAAVASGERSGARRLARSGLVAATGRLAVSLVDRSPQSGRPPVGDDPESSPDRPTGPRTIPTAGVPDEGAPWPADGAAREGATIGPDRDRESGGRLDPVGSTVVRSRARVPAPPGWPPGPVPESAVVECGPERARNGKGETR